MGTYDDQPSETGEEGDVPPAARRRHISNLPFSFSVNEFEGREGAFAAGSSPYRPPR